MYVSQYILETICRYLIKIKDKYIKMHLNIYSNK